ncbi:MAG: sodium pump decarboxylase gamma subunit [Clostridiaceae bacterium]|nr:sodium pump decarboxylase gamma subunit [Clostridiaceae bacterium]
MSYDLIASLNIMWQGMLGIFVVMIIISLIVKLLAKITK